MSNNANTSSLLDSAWKFYFARLPISMDTEFFAYGIYASGGSIPTGEQRLIVVCAHATIAIAVCNALNEWAQMTREKQT